MSSGKSELSVRLGAAVAMIGVAMAALYFGGLVFWGLVSVGAVLMVDEWGGLVAAETVHRRIAQFALAVPLILIAPGLLVGPSVFALLLIAGAGYMVRGVTGNVRLGWGLLYVGLPAVSLIYLRGQEPWTYGILLTFWAMGLVWACDSGAYFAGRAIGGPKLAPSISPNKTWAGFIGGVIGATIGALGLNLLFGLPMSLVLATPLLAALGQGGDLFESHMKRQAGVKDSGKLLPGHGGLLDRLDGLVAVAPVAALLIPLLK